jgi:thiazolinyl imide reductase
VKGETTQWRPKVVVCGTGFGRIYLAALRRAGLPCELVGILAQGSARSQACAKHYQVPLYTDPDQLPDAVDIACVVVSAGINGGRGADLAQRLMARGIHVLQEHPLHHDELAACLRAAQRNDVVYHVNTHYIYVDSVRRFIGAARALIRRQPAIFLDAVSSFQVLYTLFDILGQVLGTLRPWSFAGSPTSAVFRSLDGMLAGIPVCLRIQNQLDPGARDNFSHILHRITVGTQGGNLLLVNTHGPIVWSPRAHMPRDYAEAVTIESSSAEHLDMPSADSLGGPWTAPSYRQIVNQEWPTAAANAILEFRSAVLRGEDPRQRGQYHLMLARLTGEATARLGPPELARFPEPQVLTTADLLPGQTPPGVGGDHVDGAETEETSHLARR